MMLPLPWYNQCSLLTPIECVLIHNEHSFSDPVTRLVAISVALCKAYSSKVAFA